MTTSARKRWSVDDYLAQERAAVVKSEYFDGEVFAMAGASEPHNLIAMNVGAELRAALRGRCRVYPSDMRIKSPSGLYTYPDVVVVCGKPQFEGDRRDVLVNPSLIVEVLSSSTEGYDRGKKFEHYRQIPSLQSYLLVATDRRSVELYVRQPAGAWLLSPTDPAIVHVTFPACSLAVSEIYADVELPPIESGD